MNDEIKIVSEREADLSGTYALSSHASERAAVSAARRAVKAGYRVLYICHAPESTTHVARWYVLGPMAEN